MYRIRKFRGTHTGPYIFYDIAFKLIIFGNKTTKETKRNVFLLTFSDIDTGHSTEKALKSKSEYDGTRPKKKIL